MAYSNRFKFNQQRVNMLDLFYNFPTWVSGLAVVLICVIFAVAGVEIVGRLDTLAVRRAHNDIVGFISAIIGVIYAVLLASVAIMAWENYDKAKMVVAHEASMLGDIQRVAYGLPEDIGGNIRNAVGVYGEAVIREEWPAMRQGRVPAQAWPAMARLQEMVVHYQPATMGQQNVHAQMLALLSGLLDVRRERIFYSEDSIEPTVWWVVILGTIGTVGFTFFFGLEKRRHQLMSGLTAALAGLVIVLIAALDRPYLGEVSISPLVLQQSIEQMEK